MKSIIEKNGLIASDQVGYKEKLVLELFVFLDNILGLELVILVEHTVGYYQITFIILEVTAFTAVISNRPNDVIWVL